MSARRVAVTMGDPAGIGPEIVARLFADRTIHEGVRPFVVGNAGVLAAASRLVGADLEVRSVASVERSEPEPGVLEVVSSDALEGEVAVGRTDARAGAAAYEAVRSAIEMARAGAVAAIVTAPINKEALQLAGAPHQDHTGMLADLTGTSDYAMMLVSGDLRVALISIHVSLREAIATITTERELALIQLVARELRRFGVPSPRIAVAGLNPHAGEAGMFGDEEREIIEPAVATAVAEGIEVSGPWPGDTIFRRALNGEFDVVIAQYHDQGLIPVKLIGFERGVNVTLGLPFIRTSVDHGTAFDIAGRGIASEESLRCAFEMARELVAADGEEAGAR